MLAAAAGARGLRQLRGAAAARRCVPRPQPPHRGADDRGRGARAAGDRAAHHLSRSRPPWAACPAWCACARSPTSSFSIVYVEFGWDTEIYRARQQVAERLATVQGRLPQGARTEMGPISSIMGEIMLVAVTGDGVSPMELREIADFTIRPQILTIPGVAQVIPIGGEVRQYRVMPDPAAMSRLDIAAADIEAAIRRFGVNTGGGFIDQHAREYLIRNIGLTNRLEDLRNLVVATRQGHSILLRQVAQVEFARPRQARRRGLHGPARRHHRHPEAAGGRHHHPDARHRGPARRDPEDAAPGRDGQQGAVPPGHLHRDLDPQRRARAARGRRRGRRGAPAVPHERPRHAHLARRHSRLDADHGAGVQRLRPVASTP